MLENATRICEANFGNLFPYEGEVVSRLVAHAQRARRPTPRLRRHGVVGPTRCNPDVPSQPALAEPKRLVHIADVMAGALLYYERDPQFVCAWSMLAGARTLLVVPLLKEERACRSLRDLSPGGSPVHRQADRAGEELRRPGRHRHREHAAARASCAKSLEQQTATSEVLSVISSSQGELEPVFQAMLANATRICEAKFGSMALLEGNGLRRVAIHNAPPEFMEFHEKSPAFDVTVSLTINQLVTTKQLVHTADLLEQDPKQPAGQIRWRPYTHPCALAQGRGACRGDRHLSPGGSPLHRQADRAGAEFRRPGRHRHRERAAAQRIASAHGLICAQSLENLRTAQDRLVQTEKLASLGQLTAGIAHEIKNPLNFVNNFSGVSVELIDELQEARRDREGRRTDEKRDRRTWPAHLRGNLEKVVQHGKRADSIVKNMLLHSREGSGEHRPVDINALVEESLNLAYHGARAEKEGFNITLQRRVRSRPPAKPICFRRRSPESCST